MNKILFTLKVENMKVVFSTFLTFLLFIQQLQSQSIRPDLYVADGTVQTVKVDESTNTLYLGGLFNKVGPNTGGYVSLLKEDASLYTYDFPYIIGNVYDVASDRNGGWYLGGDFSVRGHENLVNLVHINSDHTLDQNFVAGLDGAVSSMLLSGDTLYVGGWFSLAQNQARGGFAAFDIKNKPVQLTNWSPTVGKNSSISCMEESDGYIYIGGDFSEINGQQRNFICAVDKQDGTTLSPWYPQLKNGSVAAIKVINDKIYIGGYFDTIDGMRRNKLAAIHKITGTLTPWNPDVRGPFVKTMLVERDKLYVGGSFDTIGGLERTSLASLDTLTGIVSDWTPNIIVYNMHGNEFTGTINKLALYDTTLYVAGSYNVINGEERNHLASFGLSSGLLSAWNPDANNQVYAVGIDDDELVAGGQFKSIARVRRSRLAAFDLSKGRVTSWNPNVNDEIGAIEFDEDRVYIGGFFDEVNGETRHRIAAFDKTTGVLLDWNPELDDESFSVRSILSSGQKVYIAGEFDTVAHVSRRNLCAVNHTDAALTTWDPQPDAIIYTLATNNGYLYTGGEFLTIAGTDQPYIARFNIASETLDTWNPRVDSLVSKIGFYNDKLFILGAFKHIGDSTRFAIACLNASNALATTWDIIIENTPWSNLVDKQFSAIGDFIINNEIIYAVGQVYGSETFPFFQNLLAIDANSGYLINDWTGDWSSDTDLPPTSIAHDATHVYIGGLFAYVNDEYHEGLVGVEMLNTVGGINYSKDKKQILSQNYPNPFKENTRINFKTDYEGKVEIALFDLMGKKIETLVSEYKKPGNHTIQYNAGTTLSSGIYYYRILINGEQVDARKLIKVD